MSRPKSWMKLTVALAVVALGSVIFGLMSPQSATGITTTVTIAPKFLGTVNAAAPCQAGRTVVVKRFKRRAPDKEIGRTTSGADGSWAVPTNRQFGRYYAIALASTGTNAGYGYGTAPCDKGKSPKISLGHRPHRPRRR
jgi:hypothetical protein